MTQLTLDTKFNNCNCEIAIVDKTDFKPTNPNGFTKEGVQLATNKDYHISSGIFLKIFYEDNEKIIVFNNECEFPKPIKTTDVKPIYADNFKTDKYKIPYDGSFYSLNMFIISKSFYETNLVNTLDPVLYYDDVNNNRIVYFHKGSELSFYNRTDLIGFLHSIDLTNLEGVIMDEGFIFSICNTEYCFNQMIKADLDLKLGYDKKLGKYKCPGGCPDNTNESIHLDFLRNAIAALKYLLECENYNDAQRIIDLISKCGGICSKYTRNDDCGCK